MVKMQGLDTLNPILSIGNNLKLVSSCCFRLFMFLVSFLLIKHVIFEVQASGFLFEFMGMILIAEMGISSTLLYAMAQSLVYILICVILGNLRSVTFHCIKMMVHSM